MQRLSLSSRLALLFAACTAVVSLFAGVLFSRASEAHFIELDQQLLDGKLVALRSALHGVDSREAFLQRVPQLHAELDHQPDLALRITAARPALAGWCAEHHVAPSPRPAQPAKRGHQLPCVQRAA